MKCSILISNLLITHGQAGCGSRFRGDYGLEERRCVGRSLIVARDFSSPNARPTLEFACYPKGLWISILTAKRLEPECDQSPLYIAAIKNLLLRNPSCRVGAVFLYFSSYILFEACVLLCLAAEISSK